MDSDLGISYTEFTYQLLQAHDFSVLRDRYDCRIQLGGSDQWGNIVAGLDLMKRQRLLDPQRNDTTSTQPSTVTSSNIVREEADAPAEEEVFGLTMPLLTTASGEKFGKSAGNAVWLDATKTSVSDLYQVGQGAARANRAKLMTFAVLL